VSKPPDTGAAIRRFERFLQQCRDERQMRAHDGEGEPMTNEQLRTMLADAWWDGARYAGERSGHAMKQACDAMLHAAENASPPAPSGWQPIESAPEVDGTRILGVTANGHVFVLTWIADSLVHRRPVWMTSGGAAIDPTHWMPLPPAPGQEAPVQQPSGWQQRIAAMEPWVSPGPEKWAIALASCFFCGVQRDRGAHNSDCLWQNAKDVLPANPDFEHLASFVVSDGQLHVVPGADSPVALPPVAPTLVCPVCEQGGYIKKDGHCPCGRLAVAAGASPALSIGQPEVVRVAEASPTRIAGLFDCPECLGVGAVLGGPCEMCRGTGKSADASPAKDPKETR
jgi:hypothetical protein